VREPTLLTATLLARACEVSVMLFVASFALPRDDPLPWPREHQPPERMPGAVAGAAAMGAALRKLRLDRNWSQYDLAERSGLSQSKISHLEHGAGAAPRVLTVTRLGRAFAAMTAQQISYAAQLAQAYAGEVEAPPLSRKQRDRLEPRVGLD
jgi:transcriptional regulator with XRE-family HTH domain